jgi:tetratricopeptide (TPR) repeat protein
MIDNVPPEQILFAYNNRGGAYITIELFDKAIEDFNQVISIDPAYYEAYSNRGYAYYFRGQYDEAMKDYDRAIELNQNFAKAYFNRGDLYLKTGNIQLATTDFQKACALGDKEGCNALQAVPVENQVK